MNEYRINTPDFVARCLRVFSVRCVVGMKLRKSGSWVLWYQAIGFLLIIALSWVNELEGLPQFLFGGKIHERDWRDTGAQTLVIIYVWAIVFGLTKKLLDHLGKLNQESEWDGHPVIKTAPLPAGAQFLNVVESVFSGMARAIIHNSDYPSVDAAKEAIDRYFSERNEYFSKYPKRADQRVWGKERVPGGFLEGQNCKDPLYR